MSRSSSLRILQMILWSALLLAGSGCAEPLGPKTIAGTYVLAQVNGEPLPVYVPVPTSSLVYRVADTLMLDDRGYGTRVEVTDNWSLLGTDYSRRTRGEAVRVRGRGNRLYLATQIWCADHSGGTCFSPADQRITSARGNLYLHHPTGLWEYRPIAPAP